MMLSNYLSNLQKQIIMTTSPATILADGFANRPRPSIHDILKAQINLNGPQLFTEYAFHSMFLPDPLEYCIYIMIVRPTRFSEPTNQILESKGFAVERDRFTPTEASYLVN